MIDDVVTLFDTRQMVFGSMLAILLPQELKKFLLVCLT